MQPSSLIFLVILGVWAAFFLQYWMRRREMIATARSINAFSETMRVLQASEPDPQLDLGGPRAEADAVAPARSLRAQVLVKRAESSSLPDPSGSAEPVARVTGGVAPGGPEEEYVMSPARSLRGLTLLIGAAGLLVYLALVIGGVVRPVALLAPIAMALGGFLWLRAGVQAELAARRQQQASARQVRGGVRSGAAGSAETDLGDGDDVAWDGVELELWAGEPAEDDDAVGTSRDSQGPSGAPVTMAEEVFDGQDAVAGRRSSAAVTVPLSVAGGGSSAGASERRSAPLLDEDDMPLTWQPRAVPPPLYTKKARVELRPIATQADEARAGQAAFEDRDEPRIVNG